MQTPTTSSSVPAKLPEPLPVTAIVVNYNAGSYLSACVASLLPCVRELIVIDNQSTDTSLDDVALQFADAPHLHLIRNTQNRGFAAACNQGCQRATQPYWLFLNPDSEISREALSTLLEVLRQGDQVGMVGPLVVNPDGSEQVGCRRLEPTMRGSLVKILGLQRFAAWLPAGMRDFNLKDTPLPTQPTAVPAISGSCMLVKQTAVADVGLWDEQYFLHCEDLDWCKRFWLANWQILFVPQARVLHALGQCSRSRRAFVEWHKHRGMARYLRKFDQASMRWLVHPLVLAGITLHGAAVITGIFVRQALQPLGRIRIQTKAR